MALQPRLATNSMTHPTLQPRSLPNLRPAPPRPPPILLPRVCFLDLPAELRIEIYKLALENVIVHILPLHTEPFRPAPHALTRTTRQIRREVLPLMHALCPIRCSITDFNFESVQAWIERIPSDQEVHLSKNPSLSINFCFSAAGAPEGSGLGSSSSSSSPGSSSSVGSLSQQQQQQPHTQHAPQQQQHRPSPSQQHHPPHAQQIQHHHHHPHHPHHHPSYPYSHPAPPALTPQQAHQLSTAHSMKSLASLRKWLHYRADLFRFQPRWQYSGSAPSPPMCKELARKTKRFKGPDAERKREEMMLILIALGIPVEGVVGRPRVREG